MNVLLLAPQPFYVERGTPIAVRLAATALARAGHRVDLVCYHEGEDIALDGVSVHRIAPPPLVRDIPIGFSWKKLVCDVALARKTRQLLRQQPYDVVHAVEEAVFIAVAARRRHRFALVYDMDSLMAAQLVHKWRALRPFGALLSRFERAAVRRADRVLAVCPAIEEFARAAGGDARVHLLPDVAFPLPDDVLPCATATDIALRALFSTPGSLVLYVGNLEAYQGIDLLLDALAHMDTGCNLAVVGGSPRAQERYRARAHALGLDERVRFVGARPLAELPLLLAQADILCSPRLAGVNTPMKIYSYLNAGRAIVATDIPAHAQVLDERCAALVPPRREPLAVALRTIGADAARRAAMGRTARARAEQCHGFAAFERQLRIAYQGLEARAGERAATRGHPAAPAIAGGTTGESDAAPAARPEP